MYNLIVRFLLSVIMHNSFKKSCRKPVFCENESYKYFMNKIGFSSGAVKTHLFGFELFNHDQNVFNFYHKN